MLRRLERSTRRVRWAIERRLPGRLRTRINHLRRWKHLLANGHYDVARYARHSGIWGGSDRQIVLRALITMNYHRLEKGLALAAPRPGFGRQPTQELQRDLSEYVQEFGVDDTVRVALDALRAYLDFHDAAGAPNDDLRQFVDELAMSVSVAEATEEERRGGVRPTTREDILSAGKLDLREFFRHRYSIRHFSAEPVDLALIEDAVRMAQKTPSVCNRQSSKVHVYTTAPERSRVLAHQNGNRGFGEQIDKLLLVTTELGNFVSIGERNQCWVDGGMFAASLVYALHSLGLGTCCLNCSNDMQTDQSLRAAAGIPPSEAIIMMIAVGHLPDRLNVAQSPRKRIDEVLVTRAPGPGHLVIATPVEAGGG